MKKRGNRRENTILKDKKGQSPIIFQKKNSKGQVWVETVVYLLLAFVMMGLVLSFIKPKIEEMRDKTIIEQTVEVIKEIDNSIITIGSPGNRRLLEVGIRKGTLNIDAETNAVIFEMESAYAYSEAGATIQSGNVEVTTEETARNYKVIIKRDFSQEYDLTYDNQQLPKALTKSPTSYNLYITNKGELPTNKILIDFSLQ
jgi:hypothetical protein